MKPAISKALLSLALITASGVGLADEKAHPERDGKVVLRSDKIYPSIGPYSQMVGYGNLIYFSGFIALN